MNGLSRRQQEVYNFINDYNDKNGIGPSLFDIANELNLAKSTIVAYVENLRKKNRVTNTPGVHRSLKVVSVDNIS